MSKILVATIVAVTCLFAARLVAAQESHDTGAAAEHGKAAGHAEAAQATPHADSHAKTGGGGHADDHHAGPVPPNDHKALWPGVLLILILTSFVLAAVIGPIARMHAPPAEMPVTHSHDEPPGESHHHGSSGTISPEPGHGHASDHGHH